MWKWIKRILIVTGIALITTLLLVFIFISPIAKYLIQKYDKQYTNREITIDGLWFNIFSGYAGLSGLNILEENAKDRFVAIEKLEIRISVSQLIKGKYEIEQLKVVKPYVNLIQYANHFNFNDILEKLSSTDTTTQKPNEPPLQWQLKNFQIENGTLAYENKPVGHKNHYNNLNVALPLLAWNIDDLKTDVSFEVATGGSVKFKYAQNLKTLDFGMDASVNKFNLHAWYPYLKDLMKTKALEGSFTTKMLVKGNFNEPEAIALKGNFEMDNFSVIDPLDQPLTSIEKFSVIIDTLNVKNGLYKMSDVTLYKPFLAFELYDNGNNFYRLLNDTVTTETDTTATEAYANLFSMMAAYMNDIANDYVVTNYSSDKFSIIEGHILYRDFTLHEQFNFDLENMNMTAVNLRSSVDRITFNVNSVINKSGELNGEIKLDPFDYKNMELNYSVSKLRISDFNPYTTYYVAFPFLDGIIEYNNKTKIENHQIKSSNDLKILAVKLGRKVDNKTAYDLPMKLAIALLRDNKGNIKLDIPVEGDLDDPKYKIGRVIWQIVKNILVKAATAPYKLLANMFGGNEEDLKSIQFEYMQAEITEKQYRQMEMIAKVLNDKPELNAELIQVNNRLLEKEFLSFFEMKKRFYAKNNPGVSLDSLTPELALSIKQIDVHDSLFIAFVNEASPLKNNLISLQDKAVAAVGEQVLETIIKESAERRKNTLFNYLTIDKKISANRIRVIDTKDQRAADLQTVSKFDINYFVEEDKLSSNMGQ